VILERLQNVREFVGEKIAKTGVFFFQKIIAAPLRYA